MKRLVIALPLLLIATACGGSDKDNVGLSKADYLAKTEAICKKVNVDSDALPAPTSPAALQVLIEQSLVLAEQATKDIKALEPPAEDKADLKRKVLDPLDAQIVDIKVLLEKVKAAVTANDQAGLAKLLSSAPTDAAADLDWMRAYGFKECVESAKIDR